ncbi:MAG: phosphoglycerate dehydrogenase [Spirochaetaceae bacterium]|nr:phosphoglycerate dehydrogenase [Spirochaetaceae bacterium]|tara:strand:+ start:233913 stop:235511 length:1599 start_codon:yes stop_codon:yes gene_type:complete
MQHTVLISDKFDKEGVERLKSSGKFEVIYKEGHSREEMLSVIGQAEALIIRSATKADKEVIEKASKLKLIIRAGVGVDNIDIPEASRRGIIVMNAPGGNSVSTAEQAISLLTSMARNIPQANQSMHEGKWEKKKFKGTELTGKTLGVVGLGRIGKEVVKRAKGLKMNVLGFDPYIPAEALSHLEIDIVSKEDLIKQADFITVHTPLTDTTRDLINKDNLKDLKKGVRVINCARGGIYNEEALVEGLKSGQIAGAALDVFTTEPIPADFPLIGMDNVILTPHLGASTGEAEFAVAMESIDELIEFFDTGVARNALNFPSIDPDSLDYLKPFFQGGEKAGKLLAHFVGGDVKTVELNYKGTLAEYKCDPVTTAILKGVLSVALGDDQLNYVNAPVFAKERGIRVHENKTEDPDTYKSSVDIKLEATSGKTATLKYTAINSDPLVVSMNDLPIEFKPEGILILCENNDVPGVVGAIGSFLGQENVNIASIELARKKGGNARSVLVVDDLLTADQLKRMNELSHIVSATQVDLREG